MIIEKALPGAPGTWANDGTDQHQPVLAAAH
jgi:hypothetical protein